MPPVAAELAADDRRARLDLELERLEAAAQEVHRPQRPGVDEAQDRLGGDQPRREGGVDLERVDERHELLAGDDRQAEVGAEPLRVERGEQVGAVVAGAGDEGVGLADAALQQRLAAHALLVQDQRAAELLGDAAGPGRRRARAA